MANLKKKDEPIEEGPQTFDEALELALRWLSEPAVSLPPEWLAALNREKENSSQ